MRNNFAYINFLRFRVDFELKYRKHFYELKSRKVDWKFLGTWNLMKFGQHAPCYT
jgi:hypothetical protein